MNVTLTPELEALVNEKIESGMYNSPGEVVREALLLLNEYDVIKRIRLESLRREIAIGIEQADRGEVAPLDVEAIKSQGRRLMAERQGRS